VSGQYHALATLPRGKRPPLSIRQEAGWAAESVWMRWRRVVYPFISVPLCQSHFDLQVVQCLYCNKKQTIHKDENIQQTIERTRTVTCPDQITDVCESFIVTVFITCWRAVHSHTVATLFSVLTANDTLKPLQKSFTTLTKCRHSLQKREFSFYGTELSLLECSEVFKHFRAAYMSVII